MQSVDFNEKFISIIINNILVILKNNMITSMNTVRRMNYKLHKRFFLLYFTLCFFTFSLKQLLVILRNVNMTMIDTG